MIKEKIKEIIEKYYHEEEEYYSEFRYDDEENEFWMKKELEEFLKENRITYQINEEDGFDSPGYSNEFFALSYLDENGNLELETVVWEIF